MALIDSPVMGTIKIIVLLFDTEKCQGVVFQKLIISICSYI